MKFKNQVSNINIGCFSELLQTKGKGCCKTVDRESCPSHIMHGPVSLYFIIYNRASCNTVVLSNLWDFRFSQKCWWRSIFSRMLCPVDWWIVTRVTLYTLVQIIL